MNQFLPMNLQFFAEEGDPKPETPKEQPKEEPKAEPKEQPKEEKKNEEDVNAQLQSALVELAKLKRAQEKAASEAAEYKKKWKESLSEQEKASMEKAEEQARRDEEFESMKKKLAINDLVSEYMDREFPKEIAQKIAEARYEGDNETVNTIEKQMDEVKRKKWEKDFLASRPEINVGGGTGTTYTKEQFDGMSLIERTKLKRENEAEYNRLLAL